MPDQLRGKSTTVVDLFAGPGGWDVAAHHHGLDPLGIERDTAACTTRGAAGLWTHQADVSELDPERVMLDHFDRPALHGLIASPPCQAFSVAGKGDGVLDTDRIIRCLHELATGNDTRAEHKTNCKDPRSLLVVEPLRWVLALKPQWIVLEQVPPVLALWSIYQELLSQLGYSVWAGVLEAERYGVPQTRERAVLMASRTEAVHPPAPTHQRYVYGEPATHELTFDGELRPWVSMAAALGWDESEWVQRERSGDRSEEGFDPHAEPCQTLTSKARSWRVRGTSGEPKGNSPYFDPQTRPSRTVVGVTGSWALERPATTIACDSRVFAPGGHMANDGRDNSQMVGRSENAIRLTPSEAGILQTFPPDYPWQGSRSKQFEQIGNAVPPMLAAAVLSTLVPQTDTETAVNFRVPEAA